MGARQAQGGDRSVAGFLPGASAPARWRIRQGIIANLFLDAFNDRFGTAVRPLSPEEIVRYTARVQSRVGRAATGR